MRRRAVILLPILLLLQAAQAPADDGRLLVVYDSSNSMWGALADGSRKHEAGRAALAGFLAGDLGGRRIGLRAYGHRRPADCRDSELVVPFAAPAAARASIAAVAARIKPTGRTPIAHSLREGRNDLGDDGGDILLISDGVETCDADPCELVGDWREAGVRIRVHVVGVGLSTVERSAMACIAEASGGRYFDAASAKGLAAALAQAGAAIKAPEPPAASARTQPFRLRVRATDDQGRSYVVAGRILRDGAAPIPLRPHAANHLPGPGAYTLEAGPLLGDGSVYRPVRKAFAAERPGLVVVDLPVATPAVVSATFLEAGDTHPGAKVTAYRDGKASFVFRPFDEVLARPGVYEFRTAPDTDNRLSSTETLQEGQLTRLTFELARMLDFHVVFRLPDGRLVKRNSELWRDGKKLYSVHANNGGAAPPGRYTLRSEHATAPLSPLDITLQSDGQMIEAPLAAGFAIVSYARSEGSYLGRPDRARLTPLDRPGGAVVRPDVATPVAPGRYRVEGHRQAGYFDPRQIDIARGETVKVVLDPKPLGELVVSYAPASPALDRAFVAPLEGQDLLSGFVRPGTPIRLLPGRYRVTARRASDDIPPRDVVVAADQTTRVTLSPPAAR